MQVEYPGDDVPVHTPLANLVSARKNPEGAATEVITLSGSSTRLLLHP
jgi:hypothetical protein